MQARIRTIAAMAVLGLVGRRHRMVSGRRR